MNAWQPHILLEADLKKLDDRLAAAPGDIDLNYDRAVTLYNLGRTEEAKNAYIALLKRAPAHFGALNNLGNLLMKTGYQSAARIAYGEAVKHHPDNTTGHFNLAVAFSKSNDIESAIKHFKEVLRLAPDHPEAHQGLSHLLADIGDEENARIHRIKGYQHRPILLMPYRGKDNPIALLVLASGIGGTVPIKHHIDDQVFFTSVLFVDFYKPEMPFPPHHFVFNAIGDADLCKPSLDAAIEILKQTKAPVINPPSVVEKTGRAANAERFSHIPGVVTPKMIVLSRELLESSEASSVLSGHGFSFPLLLRSPGFHTGFFFTRIENEQALAGAVASMPGKELMVIQYLDARSADGKIRKYRVMMIDGKLYPLHVAISHEWKIHYFSAEMADNPENRAEDEAFLNNMPKVLGPRAMTALEKIREMLGLDYAGADFSLNAQGDVILFEANATMVVNAPDQDTRWDYRRPAVQRILDAVRQLLTKYALPGPGKLFPFVSKS